MAVSQGVAAPDIPAGMLLVKIGRAVARSYRDALRPCDLTLGHASVLQVLRGGPTTQAALAEAVGMDATKLVAYLNELEMAGQVVRRRDAADRRRHIVELSEAGARRLSTAQRAAAAAEERLLASLTAGERAQLAALLARIDANAPAAPEDADDDCAP